MFGNALSTDSPGRETCYDGIAPFYDELYGWRSAIDMEFFLSRAARPGMRILELGCGTGRISLPLARAGHSVTALDLSAAMLAQFSARLAQEPADVRERLQLLQGNMADFDAAGNFELVLIPFRAFMHLLDSADQRSCLSCIRSQLAPGGRLIFDLFDPNFAKISQYAELPARFLQDLEVALPDGGLLRRYTRIEARPGEQINEITMRFERLDAGGRIIANGEDGMAMRWMTHNEVLLLLELSGLEAESVCSGYDGAALADRRGDLIYTCRRLGEHQ